MNEISLNEEVERLMYRPIERLKYTTEEGLVGVFEPPGRYVVMIRAYRGFVERTPITVLAHSKRQAMLATYKYLLDSFGLHVSKDFDVVEKPVKIESIK